MAYHTTDMYPVQFNVDYPEGPRNRLTVLLRIVLSIPILIVSISIGLIFFPTFLMIVFRKKYPRWWFDHNLEALRFLSRVSAYAALLRDEYPSTDAQQAVYLDIAYPEPGQLNRFMPLIKWLLAIPHYVILNILWITLPIVSFIAWLAILITGKHPRGVFGFTVGVMRWQNRLVAYVLMLCTDRYPPFQIGRVIMK